MASQSNVLSRLRRVADGYPAAAALIVDGRTFSYGDLVARIESCAGGLLERGVRSGDAIALDFPNSLDFVVGAFAALAVSAVLVPLNPRFKDEELRHCLAATRPKAVIHTPSLRSKLDGISGISVRATSTDELTGSRPIASLLNTEANAQSGVVMFSSGSTGKSRRSYRSQSQWLGEYEALRSTIQLEREDCILCTVPLFHAHGFGNAMMASLLSGARLVILTQEFSARATMRAIVTEGVTVYPAVPFMLNTLSETRFAEPPDLSRMRLFFSAGAALSESTSERFLEVYKRPIAQLYGSTETGAISMNYRHAIDKPTSVGAPLPGTRVVIRREDGTTARTREIGDVWVESATATRRYEELPEVTAECFVGESFFTGDTGYLDEDGDLFISGRKKLLINVAGYKVDPLEVEDVLRSRPDVADVVVVGEPHAGYGERVKAIVVKSSDGTCSAQELREYAAARLSDYKVPKVIEFREELPRSPLGKILRKYL